MGLAKILLDCKDSNKETRVDIVKLHKIIAEKIRIEVLEGKIQILKSLRLQIKDIDTIIKIDRMISILNPIEIIEEDFQP